jgi:meso-butanediol dehydrogenase/(S,S)-butanediol dehydrogenase/diacetyl reductase
MGAGGMTAEFSDHVVLVTGAASGIGLATAAAFAAEGALLALADVNAKKLEAETARLAAGHDREIRGYPADLASAQAAEHLVAAVLADFGRIDVVVNNAGMAFMGTVLETSVAEWDHVFATNVRAAFCVSRAVLPAMIGQGGGVIVNTASEAGLVGFLGYAAYAASKAALVNLTRCMALDHAGQNIRVNCVCPIRTTRAPRTSRPIRSGSGIPSTSPQGSCTWPPAGRATRRDMRWSSTAATQLSD